MIEVRCAGELGEPVRARISDVAGSFSHEPSEKLADVIRIGRKRLNSIGWDLPGKQHEFNFSCHIRRKMTKSVIIS
ncbi:MAG: hypothetical protein ACQEXQ_21715 [Bacillota bacterium]